MLTDPVEIALLRLVAQRVVVPLPTAADVVRWLTAVQGQDDAGAITSIALRTARRERAEVLAAYDSGEIVRSWPMRGTLHVVPAEDLGWMLQLMTPRVLAGAARRRAQLGLDAGVLTRAEELTRLALAGGQALRRSELMSVWEHAGLAPAGGRGYHLLANLCQRGVLCYGPTAGGEQLIVLLGEWVPRPRRLDREAALAELALRYFRSHGPATVKDLMRWSGLVAADVRAGIALSRDRLDSVTDGDQQYFLDPATPELLAAHRAEATGVVLLPGFDEVILGYADRTPNLAAEHADRIVPGGNGVFRSTVLSGGQVVGTWRHSGRPSARRIDTTPFTTFDADLVVAVGQAYEQLP